MADNANDPQPQPPAGSTHPNGITDWSTAAYKQYQADLAAWKVRQAQGGAPANRLIYAPGSPQSNSQLLADQKKNDLYGSTMSNLGGETEGYINTLRGNLTKNVAKADQYQNQAGRDRGIANARAGLSGVDTSAADEQSRRNAIYGAAGINEAAQRQAQDTYGKSISNRITGSQQIENSELAKALGQVPTPVANTGFGSGNGLLSGLSDFFSGLI